MEDFNNQWNKYIKSLIGEQIPTASGKPNTITSVTDDYLERISSTGNTSKIKKSYFEGVYNELLKTTHITRASINAKFGKRCSAIVTVVLAKNPGIELYHNPTISLKLTTPIK